MAKAIKKEVRELVISIVDNVISIKYNNISAFEALGLLRWAEQKTSIKLLQELNERPKQKEVP